MHINTTLTNLVETMDNVCSFLIDHTGVRHSPLLLFALGYMYNVKNQPYMHFTKHILRSLYTCDVHNKVIQNIASTNVFYLVPVGKKARQKPA